MKDNIIKYPNDSGCTGQAIRQRTPVYFNEGQNLNSFSGDVDNIVGVIAIKSMLISPIFYEDKLIGVI